MNLHYDTGHLHCIREKTENNDIGIYVICSI